MRTIQLILFLTISATKLFSQNEALLVAYTIPSELKDNANAIVRLDENHLAINDYNNVEFKFTRIVTVLNEEGNSKLGAVRMYNDNRVIKKLEARIYDAFGKEIKKIKEKDFEDISAVPGGTLYTENRRKYLDYTPISYPYTMVLEVEEKWTSTAFLPDWTPLEGYYTSTQNSSYEIINNSNIEVKLKSDNFEGYNIEVLDNRYQAKNLNAIKPEAFSPNFMEFAPHLKVALTVFDMEGVRGTNNNWMDFGKWMYSDLLLGTEVLPQSVKDEMKSLTMNATSNLEKAKLVYEYMQNKTRYISVQVGIGGWKPEFAETVDRLGYGDCKGLSNYTKALLDAAGVESYYAVIYGDRSLRNFDKEFSATQGNHVVLCLPSEDDYVWLECTSQTNPFGFVAGFTDDRDALLISPEGGKIVHTTVYNENQSKQETQAHYVIDTNGAISADVEIVTTGYQYALHDHILNDTPKDQALYYKERYWDYINNLSIAEMDFENDDEKVKLTEKLKISASDYAAKSGSRLLFQPNAFNRNTNIPTRYKQRNLDFEIERGFLDQDEFIIELDSNLNVEALPEAVTIDSKYGKYSFNIELESPQKLKYKRTFSLYKGEYPKEEYEAFRDFISQTVKYDKSRIVLNTEK